MFDCYFAVLCSFGVRQEGAAQAACKRNCGSKYKRGWFLEKFFPQKTFYKIVNSS